MTWYLSANDSSRRIQVHLMNFWMQNRDFQHNIYIYDGKEICQFEVNFDVEVSGIFLLSRSPLSVCLIVLLPANLSN